MEWAYANGYSKKYASAGWASYERHFIQWALAAGFEVDITSQYDLQLYPGVVEDYPCLVFIGHDEYWSWPMRDRVDSFVEGGGSWAMFSGNTCFWQVRFEDDGRTMVCHKALAPRTDPVMGTDRQHLVTTMWPSPLIGRRRWQLS